MKELLLLHNPTAGDTPYDADDLHRMLMAAGFRPTYVETDGPSLDEALAETFDLVVVAGGDGTVARVLSRIRRRRPPLAILPLGTANNVARSLGIEGDIPALVAGLGAGRERTLDFGFAGGDFGSQRFFESAGIGALADALGPVNAQRVESSEKIPQGIAALQRSIRSLSPVDVELDIDGVRSNEALLLLEVTKIPSVGPQLGLAPPSQPGDGRLHVVTAGPERRNALQDWLAGGPGDAAAPVTVRAARQVRVRWRDAPFHLDDDFHAANRAPASLRLEVDPQVVDVLIPEGPARS